MTIPNSTPTSNSTSVPAAGMSRVSGSFPSGTTTDRVSVFRQKLATEDLKRYEVYVSSTTRQSIRDIAAIEGISAGVAAEALLKLGIESYHQKSSQDGSQPSMHSMHSMHSVLATPIVVPSVAPVLRSFISGASSAHVPAGPAPLDSSIFAQASVVSQSNAPLLFASSAGQSKGLVAYTDRSDARSVGLSKQSAEKVTSVTQNLIEAAKRRSGKADSP